MSYSTYQLKAIMMAAGGVLGCVSILAVPAYWAIFAPSTPEPDIYERALQKAGCKAVSYYYLRSRTNSVSVTQGTLMECHGKILDGILATAYARELLGEQDVGIQKVLTRERQ